MRPPSTVARAIDVLLDEARLSRLVEKYFDPQEPFAGYTFDLVGDNPRDRFSDGDLLAITLLDVGCSPPAARALLTRPDQWSPLLAAVPTELDLWRIDEKSYDASDALWKELCRLPSIGPTKAGKLLARKRPRLIPIYDDVVERFLEPGPRGLWWDLHDALQDADRRRRIELLGADLEMQPSTLRLLDVAVWMRCGNSRNARGARRSLGIPESPLSLTRQA